MIDDVSLRGLLAVILDPASDCDHARLVYADRCDELGECERAEFIRVQVRTGEPAVFSLEGLPYTPESPQKRIMEWLDSLGVAGGIFRRGFVEQVTCSAEDWDRHSGAILQAQPVREVTLKTMPDDMQWVPRWMDRWPGVRFRQSMTLRLLALPLPIIHSDFFFGTGGN